MLVHPSVINVILVAYFSGNCLESSFTICHLFMGVSLRTPCFLHNVFILRTFIEEYFSIGLANISVTKKSVSHLRIIYLFNLLQLKAQPRNYATPITSGKNNNKLSNLS